MSDHLKAHIKKFANPSNEELDFFSAQFESVAVKSKDYLLRAGDVCRYNYFVNNGCFRTYFIDHLGNEKTINFSVEGWWMTDLESYHKEVPSYLFIQATENAEVLRISKDKFEAALEKSLELNRYFRIIGERTRRSDQKRVEYMFRLSAREVYDIFSEANPSFVQRVPQYMLASYLGFTPEFLSKIRKQKMEEGK